MIHALLPLSLCLLATTQDRKPLPAAEVIAQLPPDGGPEFNRLIFEKSPYLLQHARNPVDWWPWGAAALAEAKRLDRPIFLSVGYSTCHWCHVMEHESFEDAEVARLMNAAFVCIKVDREERPDVDQVYMSWCQAATGSGGWPLTILAAPDGKPFFAGTYFPKDGPRGMLGLVPAVTEAWTTRRAEILAAAAPVLDSLRARIDAGSGDLPGLELLAQARSELQADFDAHNGGFGRAPKFPVPHRLNLLLRIEDPAQASAARSMVVATLRAMRAGGIYDQIGLGFHRYSTDAEWLVPHFEKMLYDQALNALACIDAYQATGEAEFARTTREIFEFVQRELRGPEGAFHSAIDADSQGGEGTFYLWTQRQVADALRPEEAQIALEAFGLSADGNFVDPHARARDGRCVLSLRRTLDGPLEAVRKKLLEVRARRPRPITDDKVLTDWNGLMIAALARGARVLGEPRHAQAARAAADFVLEELRDDQGRLLKRWRDGHAAELGLLEDHAFLAWGLVELFDTDLDPVRLAQARVVADAMIARFADAERGGFYTSPGDGEALILRTKEAYDGALPSGNSAAALVLVRLARLTGETRYEEQARGTFKAFAKHVAESPSNYAVMLTALDHALAPSHEVVIVGRRGEETTEAMIAAARRGWRPRLALIFVPMDESEPAIAATAPFVRSFRAVDGRPAAYVCRNFTCEAPVTTVAALEASLAKAPAEVLPPPPR